MSNNPIDIMIDNVATVAGRVAAIELSVALLRQRKMGKWGGDFDKNLKALFSSGYLTYDELNILNDVDRLAANLRHGNMLGTKISCNEILPKYYKNWKAEDSGIRKVVGINTPQEVIQKLSNGKGKRVEITTKKDDLLDGLVTLQNGGYLYKMYEFFKSVEDYIINQKNYQ